jgi:hypothetical protein
MGRHGHTGELGDEHFITLGGSRSEEGILLETSTDEIHHRT